MRLEATLARRELDITGSPFVPSADCVQRGSRLVVRLVKSLNDFAGLEKDWRDLERRCSEPFTFFQTFDWCNGWLTCRERSHSASTRTPGPIVILIYNAGKLVFLCPLMQSRSLAGGRQLRMIGDPHTQYGNVLIDPDHDPLMLLEPFWKGLCSIPGIDTLEFNAVPAQGVLGRFLDRVSTRHNIANETALMDFTVHEDWQAYQASLSSGLRRGRAKRRNKLNRQGEVTFEVLWPGGKDFGNALLDCIRFKREWLRQTGRVGEGLAWSEFDNFLLGFSGEASELHGALIHALRLDGRNIALEYGFIYHGHYFCFLGGFDWDLNALSPGKVQIERSFKWFLENGIERYDFLPNPAAYKSCWTNAQSDVWSFSHHLTPRGKLAGALTGPKVRQRAKWIYYLLPQSARLMAGAALRTW